MIYCDQTIHVRHTKQQSARLQIVYRFILKEKEKITYIQSNKSRSMEAVERSVDWFILDSRMQRKFQQNQIKQTNMNQKR